MAGRQTPPGGGGKARRLHFSYTPTPHGSTWNAYIAGPVQWYECHCKGKTKPCLHAVTGGELCCPMCDTLNPAESTGFQPLWEATAWKPVFVIVHETVREVVDNLPHRARVLVGRGTGKTDGVYITTPLKKGEYLTSTDPQKIAPQDVWPSLLRIWKVAPLIEWDERQRGIPTGGCHTPPEKTATLPIFPRVSLNGEDPTDAAGVNEAFARAVRRAHATNGHANTLPPDHPAGEGG